VASLVLSLLNRHGTAVRLSTSDRGLSGEGQGSTQHTSGVAVWEQGAELGSKTTPRCRFGFEISSQR
jgi:hypothetical protein